MTTDDFRPITGPTLATVHRKWLDRGMPAATWGAYAQEAAETAAEPTYTLRYTLDGEPVTKAARTAAGIEMIGAAVSRAADRGKVTDIEVLDETGGDVTFNFKCFRD